MDRVLCLFRWEVEALAAHGADAVWVGHPVLERVRRVTRSAGRERPCLALLPGSRSAERARCLPAFLGAAQVLAAEPELDVVVSGPLGTPVPAGVRLDSRPGIEILADADAALVAAGTATLEAALLGVPFVCAAALHPISAVVARRLLEVDHVALPNILLGRRAIPEVVQDLSVSALVKPLRAFLEDPLAGQIHGRMLADELRERLGPPGFAARAADAVLELGDRP